MRGVHHAMCRLPHICAHCCCLMHMCKSADVQTDGSSDQYGAKQLVTSLNWFQLNHSLAHDIKSRKIILDNDGNKLWKFNSCHSLELIGIWWLPVNSLAHGIQSPEINIDDAGNKIWKFNSKHKLGVDARFMFCPTPDSVAQPSQPVHSQTKPV